MGYSHPVNKGDKVRVVSLPSGFNRAIINPDGRISAERPDIKFDMLINRDVVASTVKVHKIWDGNDWYYSYRIRVDWAKTFNIPQEWWMDRWPLWHFYLYPENFVVLKGRVSKVLEKMKERSPISKDVISKEEKENGV